MATRPDPIMMAWQRKLQTVAASEDKPDPLPKDGPDGFGGIETQGAIKAFQRDHGITVTGLLDSPTKAALNRLPAKPTGSLLEVFSMLALFPKLLHTVLGMVTQLPDDWAETQKDLAVIASSTADAPDKLDAAGDWAILLGQECKRAAALMREGEAPKTPAIGSGSGEPG